MRLRILRNVDLSYVCSAPSVLHYRRFSCLPSSHSTGLDPNGNGCTACPDDPNTGSMLTTYDYGATSAAQCVCDGTSGFIPGATSGTCVACAAGQYGFNGQCITVSCSPLVEADPHAEQTLMSSFYPVLVHRLFRHHPRMYLSSRLLRRGPTQRRLAHLYRLPYRPDHHL